jgi:hypothetical protein
MSSEIPPIRASVLALLEISEDRVVYMDSSLPCCFAPPSTSLVMLNFPLHQRRNLIIVTTAQPTLSK